MFFRVFLICSLCLAACADTISSTPITYAPPRVSENRATVVFVQQGGFINWRVLDKNRRFLGKTERKSWFATEVAPGPNRFYAFNPQGIPYAPDGFCLGFDASLDPGKLYIVLVRFISPATGNMEAAGTAGVQGANFLIDDIVNEGVNPGTRLAPTEYGFRFRFLSKREHVGMDAQAFLRQRIQIATNISEGQKELDAFMAEAAERQRNNPLVKANIELGGTRWDQIPPVCTTRTNDLALAADDDFPLEEFDRRAGKRVQIADVSKVDVPALAAKECGPGVKYSLATRRRGNTQQKSITMADGKIGPGTETTYATTAELVCDARSTSAMNEAPAPEKTEPPAPSDKKAARPPLHRK